MFEALCSKVNANDAPRRKLFGFVTRTRVPAVWTLGERQSRRRVTWCDMIRPLRSTRQQLNDGTEQEKGRYTYLDFS